LDCLRFCLHKTNLTTTSTQEIRLRFFERPVITQAIAVKPLLVAFIFSGFITSCDKPLLTGDRTLLSGAFRFDGRPLRGSVCALRWRAALAMSGCLCALAPRGTLRLPAPG